MFQPTLIYLDKFHQSQLIVVILTQSRYTWEEGISTEELPLSDYSVSMSIGVFILEFTDVGGPSLMCRVSPLDMPRLYKKGNIASHRKQCSKQDPPTDSAFCSCLQILVLVTPHNELCEPNKPFLPSFFQLFLVMVLIIAI